MAFAFFRRNSARRSVRHIWVLLSSSDAFLRLLLHCTVAALEDLLRSRTSLGIRHDFVFSSLSSPHHPISVSAFSSLIRWAFSQAEIDAPPSSSRRLSFDEALRGRLVGCQHLLPALPASVQHFLRSVRLSSSGAGGEIAGRVIGSLRFLLAPSLVAPSVGRALRQFDRPSGSPRTPYR